MESLIDALVVLYDECCSSNQKRERTVVEFVDRGEWGKWEGEEGRGEERG